MISEGAWQEVKYINCDDYDGKNSPVRKGFDLKKYITKVIHEFLIHLITILFVFN